MMRDWTIQHRTENARKNFRMQSSRKIFQTRGIRGEMQDWNGGEYEKDR